MLPRIEYSVSVPVTAAEAFAAFQNFGRLLHRGIYQDITWTDGEPWQVGSRVRYTILRPIPATIAAVVTAVRPPAAVSLLNHALGVTAEQNVTFNADAKGGTRVRITMDMVGESPELSESALRSKITFIIKDALDTMAALCQSRP